MQDFSRFVPNVHFEQIPIKNLVSNQEYQRPLSQTQVEKAIEDFDLNQINPEKNKRKTFEKLFGKIKQKPTKNKKTTSTSSSSSQ